MATIEEVKQKILDNMDVILDDRYSDAPYSLRDLAEALKAVSMADVQIVPMFDDVSAEVKATGNINYEEDTAIGFCD